ncbi:hypothetical protein SAMN05216483_6773 [Streptomyces sp. 2131.1]|uniref:hypothetical protein n=1 Tax=Streptomyces sp. 2131.1 TaxID=1855346 RepID=UPI00089581EB|nr:hypothetical protein [Streptomyces sp. 2131.1]SEE84787.1 hypothetical protein SAMN05216483_6773 [Streptomyces sp. 2131.1]
MLEAVPPDEIADGWPDYGQPRMRQTDEARLANLRRSYLTSALAAIPASRTVSVATYVLAEPGVDVEATHAALVRFAWTRDWGVYRVPFIEYPAASIRPPGNVERPELDAACQAISRGFVHGILTTTRAAMPASSFAYEHLLRRLAERLAFVAFLPLAWLQQPPLSLQPPNSTTVPKGAT